MKKSTQAIVVAGMVTLLLVVGVSLARSPLAAPPPVPAAGVVADAPPATKAPVEYTVLDSVWSPERIRACGLIDVALAPERAGSSVDVRITTGHGGGRGTAWYFFDDAGKLTMGTVSSACLTSIKLKKGGGHFRTTFTLPGDTVNHDVAIDAASMTDPRWTACHVEYPDRITAVVSVATVIDIDGSVFTSDGTRQAGTLQDCLGKAQNAWVTEQLAAGTLTLAAPAVVLGSLPRE